MFVPPRYRVPGLIEDLARFMDRQDLPLLAHVAAAHAQFEIASESWFVQAP
jgi:Fic family protein